MKKSLTIQTTWNLGLLYASLDDPKIQRDVTAMKRCVTAFAKTYRNRTDYLTNEKKLLAALTAYEKLSDIGRDPSLYYWLTKELNSNNQKAQAALTKLSHELAEVGNMVLFFELNLGKIKPNMQKRFLKSATLKPYRYFLEKIFEESAYNLSEAEEKILNLKSLPSYSLWVDGVEKALNKQTVLHKGHQLPIAEAHAKVSDLPLLGRRKLQDAVLKACERVSDFAESELNAVVVNKKIGDELRGNKMPYSATIRAYENDEKSILNLVTTVTEHFVLSNRFYKLKARLLGLKKLHYADRSVSIGKLKTTFSFEKSAELFHGILAEIDQPYADMFECFLREGHIDAYPKVGKSGGAFCVSDVNNPTYILLNHTNSFHAFMTLAHETGHAIHSEMAKTQPTRYQGYSTSVAETASTLFEALAFERVFERLSKKEQIIALHDRINDDMSTIFRQIAFFNFELELHERIRARGSLGKEEIARLLNKHTKAYLGPVFDLKDLDGYFFVMVSHFRRFFYVYSYAYGQLISKVMSARYEANNAYRAEIREFLSAGSSKSPEHIFSDIGIDTTTSRFFKEGLASVARDIDRLEKLTKK